MFIDESGLNLAMTRTYGRAPGGQRVSDRAPKDPGVSVTLTAALSLGVPERLVTLLTTRFTRTTPIPFSICTPGKREP